MRWTHAAVLGIALAAPASWAGEADVVGAEARRMGSGAYRFEVTVRHADEGWKHYADRWEVLAPDGSVLATRELRHPHVDEQPFARRLPGVEIPAGIDRVTVRTHDSVHGYGGAERSVDLGR